MMFGVKRIILLHFMCILQIAQCANILGVFTCPSPSHLIVELSEMKVLAENGHNVTIVTSINPPIRHKNFNIIYVPFSKDEEDQMAATFLEMSQSADKNTISKIWLNLKATQFMYRKMFDTVNNSRVKDLYENKANKFDLYFGAYFMNDYELGLAHKLKVPIILSLPVQPFEFFGSKIGNPRELSYVPTLSVTVERGKVMSFAQRLRNFCLSWLFRVFMIRHRIDCKKRYEILFGHDLDMPEYKDLTKNITLMFFNSHSLSEGPIRPNLPGIIEIGGIQVKDQRDPLPNDIADFLEKSQHGAILFSLGSNVRSSHLTSNVVGSMYNVLSKLKQNVIWKWDDLENIPGNSSNIFYSKWLPQDDILAHPKIKLFITHAGKGGIIESQYHGKPMLALPIFGDQPNNALNMVNMGFGLSIDLIKFEENLFRNSLNEILENPIYTQSVENFSKLYKDRPLTARQTVLYWTEYVLRHHGAKHLQSPLVHMSFIEANNLDIYGLVVGVIIIIVLITKAVLKKVYRKLIKKSLDIKKKKEK